MEVALGINAPHRGRLAAELGLDEQADVFEVDGFLALADLFQLAGLDIPEHRDPDHRPVDAPLLQSGPLGIDWLRPMNLFGISGENRLAYATGWSLSCNLLALVGLSLVLRLSRADVRQARLFIEDHSEQLRDEDKDYELSLIRISQLQALLPPFMEPEELRSMWAQFEDNYQQRLLPGDRAPVFVVNHVEAVLARIIGATSAHHAMEQLERSQQLEYSDLASMVTDASRLHTFNRELLQTTVESLLQGVSVVDK